MIESSSSLSFFPFSAWSSLKTNRSLPTALDRRLKVHRKTPGVGWYGIVAPCSKPCISRFHFFERVKPYTRSRRPQWPRAIWHFFQHLSLQFCNLSRVFVTFAFWHDLHFYWYLHDFVVVFMNLQWSKHSFLPPYIKKKTKVFVFFHLQVFANVPSSFNLASLATLHLHTKLYM